MTETIYCPWCAYGIQTPFSQQCEECQPGSLATAFCRVLNDWLDAETLSEVRAMNESESDPGICHSHDFCDSNQAMLDAMESLGVEYDAEQHNELIDAAWEIAKARGFQV